MGAIRLEWRTAKELKENPLNWRYHSPDQDKAWRAVYAEVGWAGALLYNERTGRLIDGHLRKKIAKQHEKLPVLVGSWDEETERKILLTLDPIASMAGADRTILDELLASVRFESPALGPLLERLVGTADFNIGPPELKEPPAQIDRAGELQKKWKTRHGQLWNLSMHKILCGDSTDGAKVGRLFAGLEDRLRLVWCDPPFGISYGEKSEWMERHGAQRKRPAILNDSLSPTETRELFANALKTASKHAEPGAAIYATVPSGTLLPHFIAGLEDGGFRFKHALVWVKNQMVLGRGDYHYRHETILYGWMENGAHYFTPERARDSVFEIDRPQSSPLHPTTKPIELIASMISNSTRKGDLVFDPFGGSGSTIVAGAQLGRKVYAVELDPAYVAVVLERMSMLGFKPELVKG